MIYYLILQVYEYINYKYHKYNMNIHTHRHIVSYGGNYIGLGTSTSRNWANLVVTSKNPTTLVINDCSDIFFGIIYIYI